MQVEKTRQADALNRVEGALTSFKRELKETITPHVESKVLEPEKICAVLGVTSEIVRAYEEGREVAFQKTGKKYPMDITDLKWGID